MLRLSNVVIPCKLKRSGGATRNPTFCQHAMKLDSRLRGNDGIKDFENV
jgi:hypothetical protein